MSAAPPFGSRSGQGILRRRAAVLAVAALSVFVIVLLASSGSAPAHLEAECDALDAAVSYDALNDECDLNTAITKNGTFNLSHSLHIGPAGKITTTTGPGPATGGLTLNISDHNGPGGGNLVIDTPSGAAGTNGITGDVTNAFGRPITINATGDVTLRGDGAKGGRITSSRSGLGDGAAGAGNITIKAGARNPDGSCSTPPTGEIVMEDGSSILANSSKARAGDIVLDACHSMDLDGLVESASGQTGAGTNPLGGGKITADAGCDLLVSDTGKISSRSLDPRGDRVHLEAGCGVTIFGLVESTGHGHAAETGANGCKAPDRPDQPVNTTSCAEIWSGGPLLIDKTGEHNGEVNADSGGGGNSGGGTIDLFAKGDISIVGPSVPPPPGVIDYAVHANGKGGSGGTGEDGGLVRVKSTEGTLGASGAAIAAFAGNQGSFSKGGSISAEASGNVGLDAATFDAGGAKTRGIISVRSFNGQVTGAAPGLLDTCGSQLGAEGGSSFDNSCDPLVPVSPNLVTLQGCGPLSSPAPGDGVSYTGATDPAPFTNPGDACGGAPALPSYVVLPPCACAVKPPECKWCTKSAVLSQVWQNPGGGDPAKCCSVPDILVDLSLPHTAVAPSPANPLGDSQPDTGSIQAAVDYVNSAAWLQPAASGGDPTPNDGAGPNVDGEIFIGVTGQPCDTGIVGSGDCAGQVGRGPGGTDGSENVVITNTRSARLNVFGCSVDVNAADSSKPVVTIENSNAGKVTVLDIHAHGGSVGYLVQNNSQLVVVKNSRSMDNTDQGYLVNDNNVQITGSPQIEGNGGHGVEINGDDNQIRSSKILDNGGNGADVAGNRNSINGGDVNENSGDGVHVVGNQNEVGDSNEMLDNGGDGVEVVGNLNKITKNDVGEMVSVAYDSNGGDGIHVAGNDNRIEENDVYSNGGDGIDVAGGDGTDTGTDGNLIKKNKAGDSGNDKGGNREDGIHLFGTGNILEENVANLNGGDGFDVSGGGNSSTLANHYKKDESNTSSSGGSRENVGAEYRSLNSVNVTGTPNKADNITIPKTTSPAKCATFPSTTTVLTFAVANVCE